MKNKFLMICLLFVSLFALTLTGCGNKGDGFTFKDAELQQDVYSVTVSNNTGEYSLLNKISVNDGYTWSVAKDEYGLTTFTTKIVPLVAGDNNFYIIVMDKKENSSIYKICIRRKPVYKVIFDTNGGNYISNQEVEEGNFIAQPNAPTKNLYEFEKWSYDFTKPVYSDLIIFAHWLINTYTISFDSNGGIGQMTNQIVIRNENTIISNNQFSREGYSFIGWAYEDNIYSNEESINNLTTDRGATIILKAQWKANIYNISLNLDGGTLSNSVGEFVGETDKLFTLAIPQKQGFIFGGWYYEKQKLTDIYGNSINKFTFAKDIQVKALWFVAISSAQELNEALKKDGNYILTKDIDCDNYSITNSISEFTGVFDGNNFTIINLVLTENFIYNNYGIIENLTIENLSTSTKDFIQYNRNLISNCSISGNINLTNGDHGGHGGVCESNYGKIVKTSFIGEIIRSTAGNVQTTAVGGITARNNGKIENCFTSVTIRAGTTGGHSTIIGGIAGLNYGSSTISYCYSICSLFASASGQGGAKAGGITGYNVENSSIVNYCFSIPTLSVESSSQYDNATGKIVAYGSRETNCSYESDINALNEWSKIYFDESIWDFDIDNLPILKNRK